MLLHLESTEGAVVSQFINSVTIKTNIKHFISESDTARGCLNGNVL